jgi:hypothetical protein
MKTILFFVSLTISTVVCAFPTHKPIECFPTADAIKLLDEEFGEKPAFTGVNNITGKSVVTLFINSRTGTWTMIEYDKEHACILAAGVNKST